MDMGQNMSITAGSMWQLNVNVLPHTQAGETPERERERQTERERAILLHHIIDAKPSAVSLKNGCKRAENKEDGD